MTGPTTPLLLVEDDADMADLLGQVLGFEGFDVRVAPSLSAAREALSSPPNLVLLDVGLPDGNGFDLLREIRAEHGDLPVLMLTARGDAMDRVLGLELGADDYLPKPFEPRELTARIRAVLRRSQRGGSEGVLEMNTARRQAKLQGQLLDLTTAEFDLLQLLVKRAPEPVSKDDLSEAALGRELGAYDRSVDVHMSRLRKKLAGVTDEAKILSIRNRGYQWVAPE